ncbi:MAG: UDP-N-acetylmuramoyl-tripeptide--D-alanyl-D-alanine ligase [Oscillospiraceae bacterium]
MEQGCLFIPLVGERFDGHTYLTQALESGAAGCLCSRLPEALVPGKFYVQVEDTLRALGQLAGWYREKFPIPVVQITGSAGKTTTKEIIASVLSQHFLTLKTEANYNNEIGTPQTLLRLMPEHQAAVIETGMDMARSLSGDGASPVAVITNIRDAHIENLSATPARACVKEEIRASQPGGLAVLNGDDARWGWSCFETIPCGRGELRRPSRTSSPTGGALSCTVTTPCGVYPLHIPSPGDYMIYPASMAVAIGERLGLTAQQIREGVAHYVSTGSRMRRIRLPEERLIIDDCYNANPQAMAAPDHSGGHDCRRRVAVMGTWVAGPAQQRHTERPVRWRPAGAGSGHRHR